MVLFVQSSTKSCTWFSSGQQYRTIYFSRYKLPRELPHPNKIRYRRAIKHALIAQQIWHPTYTNVWRRCMAKLLVWYSMTMTCLFLTNCDKFENVLKIFMGLDKHENMFARFETSSFRIYLFIKTLTKTT